MKHIRKIIAVLLMLFATGAYAADPAEGLRYTELNPPQATGSGNKIEVLEFFSYVCPHCYDMHPSLSAWQKTMPKDVQIDFVPVAFYPQWEPMVYTYYTLVSMNKLKQLDDALYDAWHNKVPLYNLDQIADFVAQHGVNRQEFIDTFNSFSVHASAERAIQMTRAYQIEGTPTLVVDGRYVISGLEPKDAMNALNSLIKQARKARGKH